MTNTNVNNNGANNNVNNANAQVKTKSLKCLANNAAKLEMFSLKGATNSVKNAYDLDKDKKDVRAYVESIGYSAKMFKGLNWTDLQPYASTKSGRFSTWSVLNALKKYAEDKDITGAKAEAARKKEERAAAKAAAERIKAANEAQKAAKKAEKTTAKAA